MRSFGWRTLGAACLGMTISAYVAPVPAAGQTAGDDGACMALTTHALPGGRVTNARPVAADTAGMAGSTALPGGLPAFCRVEVTLVPTVDSDIRVEVWLPRFGWNGRLQGVGNRGWGGAINYGLLAGALRDGYAAASTDTGHQGPGSAFALGHPEKVVDSGYRAVHEMTVAAKALTRAYYGRAVGRSYWNGCSLGGRQGLAEAQRYPDDYDGIAVGAPVHNLTQLYAARLVVARTAHRVPASDIPPAKYPVIHKAVLAACDPLDGVRDGVIENPRACRFEPAALRCTAEESDSCLTDTQVDTLRAMRSPIRHPTTGAVLSAGLEPGAERRLDAIAGPEPENNALGLFRYVGLGDPNWDWRGSDFGVAVDRVSAVAGPVLDAVDPDLSRFVARGGKLLLYHGWSDPQTPPGNTIDYYSQVVAHLGGNRESESVRLFMAPGVGHCSGGDGPDRFDVMAPLVKWVEEGIPPSTIEASLVRDETVVRTRPLCAHPSIAVWDGRGDTNAASSFSCVNTSVPAGRQQVQ